MISGIAVAAKALKPGIKIIAAEPTGRNQAADVAAAKAAGQLVQVGWTGRCGRRAGVAGRPPSTCRPRCQPARPQLPKPVTICDGLEARLGPLTWRVVRDLVDDVVTVSEEEVVGAMRLAMERMKARAGGACRLALAAHGGRPPHEAQRWRWLRRQAAAG